MGMKKNLIDQFSQLIHRALVKGEILVGKL